MAGASTGGDSLTYRGDGGLPAKFVTTVHVPYEATITIAAAWINSYLWIKGNNFFDPVKTPQVYTGGGAPVTANSTTASYLTAWARFYKRAYVKSSRIEASFISTNANANQNAQVWVAPSTGPAPKINSDMTNVMRFPGMITKKLGTTSNMRWNTKIKSRQTTAGITGLDNPWTWPEFSMAYVSAGSSETPVWTTPALEWYWLVGATRFDGIGSSIVTIKIQVRLWYDVIFYDRQNINFSWQLIEDAVIDDADPVATIETEWGPTDYPDPS